MNHLSDNSKSLVTSSAPLAAAQLKKVYKPLLLHCIVNNYLGAGVLFGAAVAHTAGADPLVSAMGFGAGFGTMLTFGLVYLWKAEIEPALTSPLKFKRRRQLTDWIRPLPWLVLSASGLFLTWLVPKCVMLLIPHAIRAATVPVIMALAGVYTLYLAFSLCMAPNFNRLRQRQQQEIESLLGKEQSLLTAPECQMLIMNYLSSGELEKADVLSRHLLSKELGSE